MLQTLLTERFKLAVHHGTKEMPVYLLVVARNGPRIQAVEPGNGGIASPHAGYMSAVAITMSRLATFLSGPRAQLDHATIDRTGLSGSFTFKLEWTPDDKQSADTLGPSLFTALQRATRSQTGGRQGAHGNPHHRPCGETLRKLMKGGSHSQAGLGRPRMIAHS
jgi:uncharacterized protein (TIGR03435 family)